MHVRPELMPAQVLNSDQVSLGYTTQLPQPRAPGRADAVTRVQLGVWTGGSDRQTVHHRPAH